MMDHEEISFGVIPVKKSLQGWLVFLVKHVHGGHWAFPKGKAELQETPQEAAFRELKEETGLEVKDLLYKEPFAETYNFYRGDQLIHKQVFYFLACVEGVEKLQGVEILEGKWFPLLEVSSQLTFPESRILYQRIMDKL